MSVQLCTSLKYQLGEFYAALEQFNANHEKDLESKKLHLYVASPTRIYYVDCLIGKIKILLDRFWKWITSNHYQGTINEPVEEIIHKIFDQVICGAYQARQKHLAHQVQEIESRFKFDSNPDLKTEQKKRYFTHLQKELKDSSASIELLAENFDKALEDGHLKENELDNLRHLVTNVSEAVSSFWYKMLHYQNTFAAPIFQLIPEHPEESDQKQAIDWAIKDMTLHKAIEKEQMRIDLESLLGQPIPVVELIKICQDEPHLYYSESRRLERWIGKLNQIADKNPKTNVVELFKIALQEVITAAEIQGKFKLSLGLLINRLDDKGCKLMRKEDATYIAWRNNLKEGDVLKCAGQEYVLGKEICPPQFAEGKMKKRKFKHHLIKDQFRVFSVQNHPEIAIRIGNNPFGLSIEEHKFDVFHCAVRSKPLQILETGNKKIVGLVEKAAIALKDHVWTSQNQKLDPDDHKIALRLASFLFCMRDWKIWPINASYWHMSLTQDLELMTSRWFKEGPDDYLAAEEFCAQASKSSCPDVNAHILHYLMEVSGFSEHPMALFYRKVVSEMLKTGDFDFNNLSLPYGCNKEAYRTNVSDLFNDALKLREHCLDEVISIFYADASEFKKREKELAEQEAMLKEEKTTKGADDKEYELKKRQWRRDKEELKDNIEASHEKWDKIHLALIDEWKHFDHGDLKQEMLDIKKELNEVFKEVKTLKKKGTFAAGVQERLSELKQIVEDLNIHNSNLRDQILETTVYERLLDAYLASPTPGRLPKSLYDQVVESFSNSAKKIESVKNPSYYKEQQQLIIQKNEKAIEMAKIAS